MKTVYVAGPLTKGNLFANVREAALMGDRVWRAGFAPFVPHVFSLGEVIVPREYEDAMAFDFEWVRRCDALLRLEGESPGADREVAYARECLIPVYYNLEDLCANER